MRLVIVTGLSGAGKTTALKMLEDARYFCIRGESSDPPGEQICFPDGRDAGGGVSECCHWN